MYPHQRERLEEALERAGVDALVATSPENIAYISGSGGTSARAPRFGVFARSGTALVVLADEVAGLVADAVDVDHVVAHGDFRAAVAAPLSSETRRIQSVLTASAASPGDALAAALVHLGVGQARIGIDEGALGRDAWQVLIECLVDAKIVPAGGYLAEARRVKAPYEIECLDHALRITEEALDAVIQVIERGMTEREAASLFAGEVVKRGAWPRPARIAMGERTWIAKPSPTDRALRKGDLVRFDAAASYKGYCASVARTAVLGEPAPSAESAFGALLAGVSAAADVIAPGASAQRVREATVEAVRAAGLPTYEPAGVGCGIGLASRERPDIAAGEATALAAGEVLRVDLAFYEIGSMGLRVGDTFLVSAAGTRALNRSRHHLIVLD